MMALVKAVVAGLYLAALGLLFALVHAHLVGGQPQDLTTLPGLAGKLRQLGGHGYSGAAFGLRNHRVRLRRSVRRRAAGCLALVPALEAGIGKLHGAG